MKGAGTDEDTLVRIVVCRSEVTLTNDRFQRCLLVFIYAIYGRCWLWPLRNTLVCQQFDLETIKDMYLEKYDVSLKDALKDECSGDFKRLLLAICHWKWLENLLSLSPNNKLTLVSMVGSCCKQVDIQAFQAWMDVFNLFCRLQRPKPNILVPLSPHFLSNLSALNHFWSRFNPDLLTLPIWWPTCKQETFTCAKISLFHT